MANFQRSVYRLQQTAGLVHLQTPAGETRMSGPFGRFQHKPFKGSEEWQRRYHCDVCNENMMSDEALQLHRIWEQLKLLNQELSKMGALLPARATVLEGSQ